ncbi:LysE family translocator [Anaerolineae bacterium CFX9]|nr:LysE family translocator [Anaerolineae bacterium CFX9]
MTHERGKRSWKRVFKSFVNALVIGVSVAAPVGPIGVLIIQRTLARGRRAGFITGLGVATADAAYATFAAFGITLLSSVLISAAPVIRLVGGLFLLYLGIRTLLSQPASKAASLEASSRRAHLSSFGAAFLLTITNPMTILMFAGIFAGAGLATTDPLCAALTVLGIFTGSALWWLILSTGVSLLRGRITPTLLVWINRASGTIIVIFAALTLAGLFTGAA